MSSSNGRADFMSAIRFACASCGQRLEVAEHAEGCAVQCPACKTQLVIPREETGHRPPGGHTGKTCGICQSGISGREVETACPVCQAPYHSECWQENGGCAVYGCSEVPQVEQRASIEIPASYWGQENKPCPACGAMILAAAVRCRICGASFDSAQPEDGAQFQARMERERKIPGMKRTIVLLFVFSVVPLLAPVGALWGILWYPVNYRNVHALPSFFPALCRISLIVSFGQCALFAIMIGLFWLIRGGVDH